MSTNGRNEFAAAACDGKVRFATRAAATRVVRRNGKSHDRAQRQREAYRCPVCHGWHLGRKADQERPKKDWQRYRARYEGAE